MGSDMETSTKKRKLEKHLPQVQKEKSSAPEDPVEQLCTQGFVTFPGGISWEWELFAFVNKMHERYHEEVEKRLEALKEQWGDQWSGRLGSAAATKVTAEMEASGIAVYSPPDSASDSSPWGRTGPRFYVSVAGAAWKKWPEGAPAPQEELAQILWHHATDQACSGTSWPNMIRGLGWALAPPHSDPQTLHADIWGDKPRPGRVRFHHLLWKRLGECCTTQIVPFGFTDGQVQTHHFSKLERASAPGLLYDNEVLHRGAANPAKTWASTCSIELCTRTGYDQVWKGGSEDDGTYKLLPICWSGA